jgi:hypothetical protein
LSVFAKLVAPGDHDDDGDTRARVLFSRGNAAQVVPNSLQRRRRSTANTTRVF